MLEHVQFDIAAVESWAGWERKKWWYCGCEKARRAGCECERKKIMGKSSPKLVPDAQF
jgi:hypothetical protein